MGSICAWVCRNKCQASELFAEYAATVSVTGARSTHVTGKSWVAVLVRQLADSESRVAGSSEIHQGRMHLAAGMPCAMYPSQLYRIPAWTRNYGRRVPDPGTALDVPGPFTASQKLKQEVAHEQARGSSSYCGGGASRIDRAVSRPGCVEPSPPSQAVPPSAIPFNVQAQLAADRIVNSDESALSGQPATAARPLAAQYDQTIAGMTITSTGLQISVAGTPTPSLLSAISADAGSVPVTIRTVPHSELQLVQVRKRIDADVSYWAARGIQLSTWGPDLATDKVRVVLADYTPAAASAITARYGAEWVTVATQSMTVTPSYSRTDDTEPWYSGDEIEHQYDPTHYAICTTGFSLTDGNFTYVTTAAHCFENNFTYDFFQAGGVFGDYYAYSDGIDQVLIGSTSAAGFEWSDPVSTDRAIVGVDSTDPIGGLICTDGLTNREVCSVEIDATGQTINYYFNGTTRTVYNTVYACQTSGAAAFSGGDSGGPVETTIGSYETNARGEVLANTGDAHCGWYYPEYLLADYWGMSVVLG
jgi:hypothetical protein